MSPYTLLPQSSYTLSFYITDHTDSATYFVRAVVYDATTGDVLDTQDLVKQTTNSRLYTKVTQAPGDVSGRGRRIIAVATAYSNSGYTTKSPLYQEQAENYIVIKSQTLGGYFGSEGTDYVKIREILQEEIIKDRKQEALKDSKQLKSTKPVEMPKMRFDTVLEAIGALQNDIDSIPKTTTDLSTLHSHLDKISKSVSNKEVTPVTNLNPILEKLEELETSVQAMNIDNDNSVISQIEDLKKLLPSLIENGVKKVVASSKFMIDVPKMEVPARLHGTQFGTQFGTQIGTQKEEYPFDISRLIGQTK